MALQEMTITDKALEKIKAILTSRSAPDHGIRVKVVGGGCSGLQYKIDIDTPRQGDKVFEKDGVKVCVDVKSYLYLHGTEMDYTESLTGSGFTFRNPNAKRACGCGQSFSV